MRSVRLRALLGGLLLTLCTACDDPTVLAWRQLDAPGTPRERRGGVLQATTRTVRLRGEALEQRTLKLQRTNCFTQPCPQRKEVTSTWHLKSPLGGRHILLGKAADAAQHLEPGHLCLLTGELLYPQQTDQGALPLTDGTVTDWSAESASLTLNNWRVETCEPPRRGLWR